MTDDSMQWNPPLPPPPTPAPVSETWTPSPTYAPNLIVAMLASVGTVIGGLGPWAKFLVFDVGAQNGMQIVPIIAGIVSAGTLFGVLNLGRHITTNGVGPKDPATPGMRGLTWFAVGVGVIPLGIALYCIQSIVAIKPTEVFGADLSPSLGWGLWMMLISSVVLIVTGSIVAKQVPK